VRSPYCKLLFLGKEGFERILGDIDRYLKKNYDGVFDKFYEASKKEQEEKEAKLAAAKNEAMQIKTIVEEEHEEEQSSLK